MKVSEHGVTAFQAVGLQVRPSHSCIYLKTIWFWFLVGLAQCGFFFKLIEKDCDLKVGWAVQEKYSWLLSLIPRASNTDALGWWTSIGHDPSLASHSDHCHWIVEPSSAARNWTSLLWKVSVTQDACWKFPSTFSILIKARMCHMTHYAVFISTSVIFESRQNRWKLSFVQFLLQDLVFQLMCLLHGSN